MSIRDDIVARAKWWAEPGTYAPTAWDFLHICDEAGIVPGQMRPNDLRRGDLRAERRLSRNGRRTPDPVSPGLKARTWRNR